MAELFFVSIVMVLVLYVPGYFFFRAIRCSNLLALAAAPLASCAAYGVLPIVYYELGITCNVATVVIAPTLVFMASFAASWYLSRKSNAEIVSLPPAPGVWRNRSSARESAFDWAVFALYLLCGILVCSLVLILSLATPEAFFSRLDNQTHLNLAQAFIDSGIWSSFHHSNYLASAVNQIPRESVGNSFYPATWHALVAIGCLATGTKVTICSNALTAVVAALVFPSGMFIIIRSLFANNRAAFVAGALMTVGFATYPWVFPSKGPTLPNMLAFALMVSMIGLFITYLEQGLVKRHIVGFICFALIAFISLTISHTNALFTAFVYLAAYGGHYLWVHADDLFGFIKGSAKRRRAIVLGIYIALILAFWAFCLTTPLLRSVTGYTHIENKPIAEGIIGLLTLRLTINSIQIGAIFVSIVGIVVCIRRRIWWMLIPVVYMAITYFVMRVSFEPWLYIFGSLWYSLPYRAAACLCIFLMPIASLGLAETVTSANNSIRRRFKPGSFPARLPQIGGILVVLLFIVVTFPTAQLLGGHYPRTPYASVALKLTDIYSNNSLQVYGGEEVAFVDKCMEKIPEGALVLNSPNDGSLFAYGVNHMNVYYRVCFPKKHVEEARLLRNKMNEYSWNPEVQRAVKYTGAQYVLQLDQGVPYEELIKLPQFYEKNRDKWEGIDAIRDNTPGFELVLSEGDMRLYKIL